LSYARTWTTCWLWGMSMWLSLAENNLLNFEPNRCWVATSSVSICFIWKYMVYALSMVISLSACWDTRQSCSYRCLSCSWILWQAVILCSMPEQSSPLVFHYFDRLIIDDPSASCSMHCNLVAVKRFQPNRLLWLLVLCDYKPQSDYWWFPSEFILLWSQFLCDRFCKKQYFQVWRSTQPCIAVLNMCAGKLVRKYLCISAASVPSEWVSSKGIYHWPLS